MPPRPLEENILRLTTTLVSSLALLADQNERIVWDTYVPGLGIRIRKEGRKSWVIRPPRVGNKSTIYTLGPASVIPLKEARKAAKERLASAFLGEDVRAFRREAREQAPPIVTVGTIFDSYVLAVERRLRPTTIYNLKHHLDVHWKPLRGRPLNGLKRATVAARLHEIVAQHGAPSANRARVVLSGVFNWAIGEGLAETNPVIGTNKPAPDRARSRVLKDAELAAVWRACQDDDFGRILKLLILTGQRRDEVAGMAWFEIDVAAGLWTLPEERSKNHRSHEVPLAVAALAILDGVPRQPGRGLVFGRGEGPFTGFGHAKARLDKRLGSALTVPWRIHDLRRTAATGMANLGVLPHVVEAVLNHVSGSRSGVAGIYNRASYAAEKRDALDRWADHVAALVFESREG